MSGSKKLKINCTKTGDNKGAAASDFTVFSEALQKLGVEPLPPIDTKDLPSLNNANIQASDFWSEVREGASLNDTGIPSVVSKGVKLR